MESSGEEISCTFLSSINKTFLRTNRSSGQKSIRYDVRVCDSLKMDDIVLKWRR